MTKVDQFESMFRAADKPVFHSHLPTIKNVLVVTDLDQERAQEFTEPLKVFLRALGDDVNYQIVTGNQYDNVNELLTLVDQHRPDLIATYRHLKSNGWKWPYGLGEALDVLTQVTPHPVLVIHHPEVSDEKSCPLLNTDRVMAITDHLAGEEELVNFAYRFTAPNGKLFLTHIEDEIRFERTMDLISKIPTIDTEGAREDILKLSLKEPHDYILSCKKALEGLSEHVSIEEIVTLGKHLEDYKRLILEHEIDLLIFNTKDEDQLAMHGMAYPLAVEFRQLPLLML